MTDLKKRFDKNNESPEFDALGHAWHEGWEAGIRHIEEPLTDIWKRWCDLDVERPGEFPTRDLILDIGDLLDYLGK